jgi:CheY-like chemotaxis protein
MDYLLLAIVGLLGGAYIVCSVAEFLLWLFERKSSEDRCPIRVQTSEQEGRVLTALFSEDPGPVTQSNSYAVMGQKPGILIADDHRLYRRMLETWFREHGFIVWAAADGREAVELHRAHAKDISLALLDVCMPSLDGPGTLATLRQEAASLPCCFMTASLTAGQEALLLAQGACRVFEKPLILREATAVILDLIDRARSSPLAYGHAPGE